MVFKKSSLIKVEGLNFERLLHFLTQNKVKINKLKRIDVNILQFNIENSDYIKLNKLGAFKNYKVIKLKEYGVEKYTRNYKNYIGLLAGLAISVLLFVLLSKFTFNINIKGNNKIESNKIISLLNKNNIKTGKINTKSNHEIELLLKSEFDDISLVSVIKQGTNIIINIKEKEEINKDVYTPIVATQNLIIKNLIVSQGTAVKNVGDIVKKGDVIVEAFVVNSKGEEIPSMPIAELECEEWHIGVVEFENVTTIKQRTKNKIVNNRILFGEKTLFNNFKDNNFSCYDNFIKEQYVFNNYFLPIKIIKEIIYEIEEKVIENDFEKEKDALIKEAKEKAYKSILNKNKIETENVTISTHNNLTIIQVSVQVNKKYLFNIQK